PPPSPTLFPYTTLVRSLRSSILPPVHGVNGCSELFEYARQPTHRVLNFWLACYVSIVAHNDLAAPPGDGIEVGEQARVAALPTPHARPSDHKQALADSRVR